jgi:hypothetical protein
MQIINVVELISVIGLATIYWLQTRAFVTDIPLFKTTIRGYHSGHVAHHSPAKR